MRKRLFALAFVLALLTSVVAGSLRPVNIGVADSVVNDWPMFQYGAAHCGSPDDVAPLTHDLLWTTDLLVDKDAFSIVGSSPAIVDGVVYIGSDDGYVYALNDSSGDQ